jgi:hypothetical protein
MELTCQILVTNSLGVQDTAGTVTLAGGKLSYKAHSIKYGSLMKNLSQEQVLDKQGKPILDAKKKLERLPFQYCGSYLRAQMANNIQAATAKPKPAGPTVRIVVDDKAKQKEAEDSKKQKAKDNETPEEKQIRRLAKKLKKIHQKKAIKHLEDHIQDLKSGGPGSGRHKEWRTLPGGMSSYGFLRTHYQDKDDDSNKVTIEHDTNTGSVDITDKEGSRKFDTEPKAQKYLEEKGINHNFAKAYSYPEARAADKFRLSYSWASRLSAGGPGSGRHKEFGTAKNYKGQPILTAKQKIAVKYYKPANLSEQRLAHKGEMLVARALNGVHTNDSHPFDVIEVKNSGTKHAVEVKNFFSQPNEKIGLHLGYRDRAFPRVYMKADAIARKVAWANDNSHQPHTVVLDWRQAIAKHGIDKVVSDPGIKPDAIHYKPGIGTTNLGKMDQVSFKGLKKAVK